MIRYTFHLEEDGDLEFKFDENSDISPDIVEGPIPGWMRLERHQCDDCTLATGSRRTCPGAVAIRPIVEGFGSRHSFEMVRVTAQVRHVTLESTEPVQRTIRSLMSVALPLSSCPVMRKARPLAYQHVPFAIREYEAFRFLGMHFIAQYLRAQDGLEPDWELKGLLSTLRAMRRVHARLAERIRSAAEKDASVNSLLLFDAITDLIELSVEGSLKSLRPLFREQLEHATDRRPAR